MVRQPRPHRPRRARNRRRVLAVLALGGLALAAAGRSRLPARLVGHVLERAWRSVSGAPLHLSVTSARWGRVRLSDLRAGPPDSPLARASAAQATFGWASLLERRLDTLRIEAFETRVETTALGLQSPLLATFHAQAAGPDPLATLRRLPTQSLALRTLRIELPGGQDDPPAVLHLDLDAARTGRGDLSATAEFLLEGLPVQVAGTAGLASCGETPDEAAITLALRGEPGVVAGWTTPPWHAEATLGWCGTTGLRIVDSNVEAGPFELLGVPGLVVESHRIDLAGNRPRQIEARLTTPHSAATAELRWTPPAAGQPWEGRIAVQRFELQPDDAAQSALLQHLPWTATTLTGALGAELTLRGRSRGTPTLALTADAEALRIAHGHWDVRGITGCAELMLRQGRLRSAGEQSLRFDQADIGGLHLEGGRVRWTLEPERLRVSEAELNWLGGQLRAYAMNVDLAQRQTAFVLYVEGVELRRLLELIRPLDGLGEGRLYGRLPVRWEGGRWKLDNAFLVSMPGEGGLLQLRDTRALTTLLAQAGLSRDVRDPLAEALRDFRFETFALELHAPDDQGDSLLRLRLVGTSRDERRPTPVHATLNLRGPIESLLNLGLGWL